MTPVPNSSGFIGSTRGPGSRSKKTYRVGPTELHASRCCRMLLVTETSSCDQISHAGDRKFFELHVTKHERRTLFNFFLFGANGTQFGRPCCSHYRAALTRFRAKIEHASCIHADMITRRFLFFSSHATVQFSRVKHTGRNSGPNPPVVDRDKSAC